MAGKNGIFGSKKPRSDRLLVSKSSRDAAARLKNGTRETMSLPGYDARYRAESERGEHGRPDRERRWRGNLNGGRWIYGWQNHC